MGEDAQGITRGFFSDFWEEFCKVYVDGGNLSVAPDKMLPVEHIKSLGRIFVAGFITTGFIPALFRPQSTMLYCIGYCVAKCLQQDLLHFHLSKA